MTDVVAPVVAAISKADDAMELKTKNEVFELINQKYPNGEVAIGSNALVIYGEKLICIIKPFQSRLISDAQ